MSCPSVPAGGAKSNSLRKGNTIMDQQRFEVTGGVDTHKEVHVAAAIDQLGRIMGTASFPTTQSGYRQLLSWLTKFGNLGKVGIEGTGAYGAGLSRFLTDAEVTVVEVNRPDRQRRRLRGKNDTVDAESAARSALNGEATAIPKSGDGLVEALRALRLARRSAIKARTQAGLQIRDLVLTAPSSLREILEPLSTHDRALTCSRMRPTSQNDPVQIIKKALRSLGQRVVALTAEIEELDPQIASLCAQINPALLGAHGVGPSVAATLLVVAGDNPERLHSEAAFAALCGVAPIEASSGRTTRHRLNRGGNRQANTALWTIALSRMATDQRTKDYVAKRTSEGKTKKEIIRCLQRHIAREIHRLLVNEHATIRGTDLRKQRKHAQISLETAANHLDTWPIAISRLERELTHNTQLANQYQTWLHNQAA